MNTNDKYTDPDDLFGKLGGDDHEGLDDFEKEALEGFEMLGSHDKAEEAYNEVLQRLAQKQTQQPAEEKKRRKAVWWFSAAAGLALVVLLSVFLFNGAKEELGNNLAMVQAEEKTSAAPEKPMPKEASPVADSIAQPVTTKAAEVAANAQSGTYVVVTEPPMATMEASKEAADEAPLDESLLKKQVTTASGVVTQTVGGQTYTWDTKANTAATVSSGFINATPQSTSVSRSVNGNASYTINGKLRKDAATVTSDVKVKQAETATEDLAMAPEKNTGDLYEKEVTEVQSKADTKKAKTADYKSYDKNVAMQNEETSKAPPANTDAEQEQTTVRRKYRSSAPTHPEKDALAKAETKTEETSFSKDMADTLFCATPLAYYEGGEKALQKAILKEFAKRHPGQTLSGTYAVKGRVDAKGVLSVVSISSSSDECANCKAWLQAILQGMKGWHAADADGRLVSSEPVFTLTF